ncbi:MAG: exo-alpha-sialidase, partial [Planctomycetaceae bacterium]
MFNLRAVCAIVVVLSIFSNGSLNAADEKPLDYTIELTRVRQGYDGKMCWVHARAGAIPARGAGNSSDLPIVVMTTQKLVLERSDVFYG